MTTPAEIEAAFFALPADRRGELLDRLWQGYGSDPAVAPPLGPEVVAEMRRRVEQLDRGEGRTFSAEHCLAGLTEAIRRVGAGEDPDAVLAELRERDRQALLEEPADVL